VVAGMPGTGKKGLTPTTTEDFTVWRWGASTLRVWQYACQKTARKPQRGTCALRLSDEVNHWSGRRDSNARPSAWKVRFGAGLGLFLSGLLLTYFPLQCGKYQNKSDTRWLTLTLLDWPIVRSIVRRPTTICLKAQPRISSVGHAKTSTCRAKRKAFLIYPAARPRHRVIRVVFAQGKIAQLAVPCACCARANEQEHVFNHHTD